MAILEINTTNADVSWVIFKNPQTQKEKNEPFKKPLRNGYVYGWYVQENHFKMFFKDGKNSSFYKELDNIHLDQSAYNCSYVYCAMISEMLRSTIQSQHEKDIVCKQTVKLNTVYLTQLRVAESFIKYFSKDVHIELKELSAKIYSVEFSGAVSLFYLINLVQVFCLLQSIEDRNLLLDLSTSTLTKYAHNLINIDAPYFIVYIFISRAAKEMQSFKAIKNIFEQFKPNWNLSFGNTQKQRYDVIKKELTEVKERFGVARKTEIQYLADEMRIEDLIEKEDVVITISHLGYIKRTSASEYRQQRRGGRGAIGSKTRDEDFVEHLFVASTHDTMLFFTQQGRCYWLKVYENTKKSGLKV